MKARRLPQERIVHEVIEYLQEIIWEKIGKSVKEFIKSFIENLLEEELNNILGAKRYERNNKRKGYRNGHYERSLLTRYGPIENIQVPRREPGGVEFSVFDRYERRRLDLDAAIGQLFVNGISTRKLKGIAKQLYGQQIGAQTVSNTLGALDKELERYKDKPIADTVKSL
jgi:transposase-like protein